MTDPDPLAEVKARRKAREDWFVSREPRRWYDDGSCRYCGKDQAGADRETGDLHEDNCPAQSDPGPDIDWLVGEVERLREYEADWVRVCEELRNAKLARANMEDRLNLKIDEQRAAEAKLVRLRDLLGRLEWAGTLLFDEWYNKGPCCPVCHAEEGDPHGDCWLAEALGRG
jgi:hypothetical protein